MSGERQHQHTDRDEPKRERVVSTRWTPGTERLAKAPDGTPGGCNAWTVLSTVDEQAKRARARVRRAVALAGIALGACSSTPVAVPVVCPPSPFRSSPPLVIAHGGGEGLGPTNTTLAMQRSIAAGADILDADLWMTSDGVIVARHDRDLATTTDGTGNVDEQTWANVSSLDTRAGWTGDAIPEPERVPTLEQILTTFPDERISLEIKQTSPSMAAEFCDAIVRTGSIDRVYLSANDDSAVYEAQRECPADLVITTTYADLDVMRAARANGTPYCNPAPIGQPPYRGSIQCRRRAMVARPRCGDLHLDGR